jgi:glycosyltransferase involved in cell wall biosynthesis
LGDRGDQSISLSELIPTTEPKAALDFCRALAHLMNKTTLESIAKTKVDQLQEPELSIVIPVYDEQDNLDLLYQRLTQVMDSVKLSYEIIFVDDGSLDRSLDLMKSLVKMDERIMVVELARNFGHQVAISAGIDHARGKAVIIMDADLQDPPEVLPQFIDKWREGHDVVYAIRNNRKEGWFKRSAYNIFYRLLQHVASIEIPLDAGDFCIMDRKVVDILVGMPERNRFVRGIRSWVGLDQVGLAYDRESRYAGNSKYNFTRLLYLALDGLVSFSYLPLRAITLLGFSISFLSITLALAYAVRKLTFGLSPPGFATLVVSIFFFSGVQLTTLGVIGEYLGRVFEEVKQRPLYVVRNVLRNQS